MGRRKSKFPELTPDSISDSNVIINTNKSLGLSNMPMNRTLYKPKKTIHYTTKNLSFIKFRSILESLGVKNNAFHLVLYDRSLMNVDPFDPNLSMEMKSRIIKECAVNFWYFIRECVRIPVPGSTSTPGSGAQYAIHRGNAALNYLILNSIDVGIELPRQNFKSVSIDVILFWLETFGTTSTNIAIMNKQNKDSEENIKRMRDIRDRLPLFLRGNVEYNKNGELTETTENVKRFINTYTKNTISIISTPSSYDSALNAGRGFTAPVLWIDECAFVKHVDIAISSAIPIMSESGKAAEKNGVPHSFILSTTPGEMATDNGRYIYETFQKCLLWRDKFYDLNLIELKEFIKETADRNNGSPMVYIEYQWYQIGRDKEWWEDQIRKNHYNWTLLKKDYLLQWDASNSDSPFDKVDIDELDEMLRKKAEINAEQGKDVHIESRFYENKYEFKMYKKVPRDTKVIFGIDVGEGYKQDSSTIVVVEAKTKCIIGLMETNEMGQLKFADVVIDLMTFYYPNSVWVIERNRGGAMIEKLLQEGYGSHLYKQKQIDITKERMTKGYIKRSDSLLSQYGIYTSAKNRPEMHEILYNQVVNFKYRLVIPEIIKQLKDLVVKKTASGSRIDHMDGKHDDLIMGYLMAMYVLYRGNNIGAYGIVSIPDEYCTSEDSEEVENYYEYAQREAKVREDSIRQMLTSMRSQAYYTGRPQDDNYTWYQEMKQMNQGVTNESLYMQEQKEMELYLNTVNPPSFEVQNNIPTGRLYGEREPLVETQPYDLDFSISNSNNNLDPLFFNH